MITRNRLSYITNAKYWIWLFVFVGLQNSLFAQNTPQAINYQAVARNNEGNPLSEVVMQVEITILQGSPDGNEVYTETHAAITDVFGLFNIKIGQGAPIDGVFSEIDWGNDNSFLKVTIDAGGGSVELPTVQLISVPYALHAAVADTAGYGEDEDANPFNELQTISKAGNTITLSDSGGSYTDDVDDADADPENEMQELQLDGQQLSLSNDPSGTVVDLGTVSSDDQQLAVANQNTSEVTLSLDSSDPATFSIKDDDANPSNEIQTLSKEGSTVSLSNGGGSFNDDVDDADNDLSNEIQQLQFNGTDLSLSNDPSNTTVNLEGLNQELTVAAVDNVNVELALENSPNVSFPIEDSDADPENEYIDNLTLTNTDVLQIQEGSNNQSIDLSSLKQDKNWTPNGNDISNSNTGNVGVNEVNPNSTLFVGGSLGGKVRIEVDAPNPYDLGDELIFIGKPIGGDVEINLPDASTAPGRIYYIKNGFLNFSSDVVLLPAGGQKVNFATEWRLRTLSYTGHGDNGEGVIIVSDGIDTWWIISWF